MATAPNDAPIKVKVNLHVHLYLGFAVFLLSAIPFFTVILLNGGAEASIEVVLAALGLVALLHVALGLTARLLYGQIEVLGWHAADYRVYDVWDWGHCDACCDSLRHSRVGRIFRNRIGQLLDG